MAEIIKLGSLYFGGQPQKIGTKYNGERITLGPAAAGKEIQWVKAHGLLIADRCVCTDISWEQLDDQGLVFGTLIQIDETTYLCRCLTVGAEEDVPNEWDTVLDEAGEDVEIWHWSGQYFWGQETLENQASRRAVRGYCLARYWGNTSASNRYVGLGFRPALEPLGSEPCSPETLIGKTIRLYGPRGASLEGRLQDVDDYDFVLTPVVGAPTRRFWTSKAGDDLVVSRDSILWFTEA